MKFYCHCAHLGRAVLAMMTLALCAVAVGQTQVKVTSVYTVDYHGVAAVPEVGDPFVGVAGNFTITGSGSNNYTITVTCGAQSYTSQNVALGPGTNYWWWIPFDSSVEGPLQANFSISSPTSSSSLSASLPVNYPPHAIEFIDAKQMNITASQWVQFQPNSGTISGLSYLFGEPQLTSSQGPTISYTPPAGGTQIITQPLGIPVESVQWLNLNTAVNSLPTASQAFSTTLHDSRVNPAIMRTVPWSAINATQPPDVSMWQQSETWVPTSAPEITNLITNSLPTNYQSSMTPWDAARAVFTGVVRHFTYNDTYTWDPIVAYDRGTGACGDFSYIFVAGMRQLGFAAHVTAGWRTGVGVVHVWAEFYMPGVGWVPADATDSNGIDPTGTFLYHFGTVPDLNTRVCDAMGGNSIWPFANVDITNLQVPWWWWNGGGTYVNSGSTLTLLTPTAMSLIPATQSVASGGGMFAHLELQNPAPVGGVTAFLTSNSTAATVTGSVTIGDGGTMTNFPITIGTVTQDTPVTITATWGSVTQQATFTIHPVSVAARLDSKWYGTSANPQVTVTLSAPAQSATTVTLSSNILGWTLPANVMVPQGSTSASVSWPLPVGTTPTPISVVAKLNNQTDTDTALAATRPFGVYFQATSANGSTSVGLTVRLASPAPAGGLTVTLSSSSNILKPQSSTVTVAAGATAAIVQVAVGAVINPTNATLTAVSSLGTTTVGLTALPISPRR